MSVDTTKFFGLLSQFNEVKAPGVSGSRIRKLVDYVVQHPDEAPQLVDCVIAHSKESPMPNKLGTMYVIDAIARAMQDNARKTDNEGPAAGLARFRESIDELMDNLGIRNQSTGQFDKMRKVLDIWQKADTFDGEWLEKARSTYFKEPYTTTPPGSPPQNWAGLPAESEEPKRAPLPTPPAPDANALLGMLQSLAETQPDNSAATSGDSGANSKSPDPSDILQQLLAQNGPIDTLSADPRAAAVTGNLPPAYQRGREAATSGAFERNRSRSPSRQGTPPDIPQPKTRAGDATRNLSTDSSLEPDRIRVYSRTLYVGAIPERYDEIQLRNELSKVTALQSVIFNKEKHHAFVKVTCRKEAEKLRNEFERMNREGRTVMRLKWGVGFGPRECFDYFRGVSVIPLMRLTEADTQWAISAEYGGTGGKPLVAGMVLEEPDIEVGAGNLGSKSQHRQRMLQQQQQQQQQMMMMGGMPGMMGMPGVPRLPGMPGMPGGTPTAQAMPQGMPEIPFMMPGFPMMPPGTDMQQMFVQMQQMMQMQNPKQE